MYEYVEGKHIVRKQNLSWCMKIVRIWHKKRGKISVKGKKIFNYKIFKTFLTKGDLLQVSVNICIMFKN